jgi:hypothetical protein
MLEEVVAAARVAKPTTAKTLVTVENLILVSECMLVAV